MSCCESLKQCFLCLGSYLLSGCKILVSPCCKSSKNENKIPPVRTEDTIASPTVSSPQQTSQGLSVFLDVSGATSTMVMGMPDTSSQPVSYQGLAFSGHTRFASTDSPARIGPLPSSETPLANEIGLGDVKTNLPGTINATRRSPRRFFD